MSSTRQLAAIMFTDIVGYTALMGKDSKKAMELVRKSKTIQKPLVEKHNGKWLKEMGDGAMAQFSTALDAVNCALEIQQSASVDFKAKIRIGIHSGDITIENDDVYGDGVNVAARLESIADPGGIYISDAIEKAMRGQSNVQAKYLGEINLKNVDYGVRTYALQNEGLPVPDSYGKKGLTGHLLAEINRRGVLRAGIMYLVFSLLLILLWGQLQSWGIDLPDWSLPILYTLIAAGFPIALYLAWTYERSPEGFVKTSSKKSWQNPYSASQRKPFTSTFLIAVLVGLIVIMNFFPSSRSISTEDPSPTGNSIAVLAFDDMSPEGDQEYFCDGISEEIINNLAQIKELKVIGRSSSFQFKGKNPDYREIKEKLGVSTFLEGSIRKSGNQIRVAVQLINVDDGAQIWSDTYDRDLDDIFKIQDEISASIATQLKVSLGISDSQPVDIEIFDLYLRARTLLNQRGPGVEQSIPLFEQILEIDSTYQPAWTGLANAWIVMHLYSTSIEYQGNSEVTQLKSEEAAQKALSIDPDDAEALGAMATIYRDRMEWSKALDHYEKALSLNNRSTVILEDYVQFLQRVGYSRKALNYAQRMIEIDPLTPLYLVQYGSALQANNREHEAMKAFKKAIDIDPNYDIANGVMFWMYLNMNKLDSARLVLGESNFTQDRQDDYLSQVDAVQNGNSDYDFPVENPLYFAMNELGALDAFYRALESDNLLSLSNFSPINPQFLTYHSERFIKDPRMKIILRNNGLLDFWQKHGWPDRCKSIGEDDFICD